MCFLFRVLLSRIWIRHALLCPLKLSTIRSHCIVYTAQWAFLHSVSSILVCFAECTVPVSIFYIIVRVIARFLPRHTPIYFTVAHDLHEAIICKCDIFISFWVQIVLNVIPTLLFSVGICYYTYFVIRHYTIALTFVAFIVEVK